MRGNNFKAGTSKQLISCLLILSLLLSSTFLSKTAHAEIDLEAKYGYCEYPLNVRKGPSIDSEWIRQYPAQSTIPIFGVLGDWCIVEDGFVKKEFVLEEIDVYMHIITVRSATMREEASLKSKIIANVDEGAEYIAISKKNGFIKVEGGGWIHETACVPYKAVIASEQEQYTLEELSASNMANLKIQAIGHIVTKTKAQSVTTKKALYFKGDIPIYCIIDNYAYFPSGRNIYKLSVEKFTDIATVDATSQILDSYRTVYYDSSTGRKKNIELVSAILDGTIIQPNEAFSYNNTTGTRSAEKGYQLAKVIVNGEYVDDYGGGVCQVSSTIYAAIMHDPNITVEERREHGLEVTYLPYGMDATVSYGNIDLRFTNHYPFAVVLNVSSKDGVCMVTLTKQE